MSNTTENDILKAVLQGTDISFRAGANLYLALFTADPTEAGVFTNEATYTGYARIAMPKASSFTDGGSTFTNTSLVQFGICTAGSSVVTHFALCTALTAGQLVISGALSASLNTTVGVQPQFASASLTFNAD
jgi:hypothetical protein